MAEREERRPLVQWGGLARVVLVAGLVALALVAVVAGVLVVAGGRPLRDVAPLAGLVVVAFLVTVVLAVGWSAVRGMLRAGDHGERLASRDVGLLPPQARRRGSRDASRRDEL
ncbi:MAG: hypothetical protein ACRDUY_03085 [Nitriliruptorales bacterium]